MPPHKVRKRRAKCHTRIHRDALITKLIQLRIIMNKLWIFDTCFIEHADKHSLIFLNSIRQQYIVKLQARLVGSFNVHTYKHRQLHIQRRGKVGGNVDGPLLPEKNRACPTPRSTPCSCIAIEATANYLTTSTGILEWETTSAAWLPSSRRPIPRRPWEAMTIRSQPLSSAA